MKQVRKIERVLRAYPTVEGAGVRLHRAFGYYEMPQFDPFLLLDDLRSGAPEDYPAGFPLHPHRGIETVTYMLEGAFDYEDSQGTRGSIGPGDVQWLTAGSGIIHREVPRVVDGCMGGFQLWINLPRAKKMMNPRYQGIPSGKIPVISIGNGITIRVIAGRVNGTGGPVWDNIADPEFLDVSLAPDTLFTHPVKPGNAVLAYVIGGEGTFDTEEGHRIADRDVVLFGEGSSFWVRSFESGMRFLLLSGKPVGEPVAWRGSIVMNTREELRSASREYDDGTFIKGKR